MKILHINRNYVDNPLHQLMVEQLDELGYINQVFVPRRYHEKSKVLPNSNVFVSECFNKNDKFFFARKQKKIINSVQLNIDVEQYDLIHAYTLFTDGNCARNLARKYNKSYVVAVRNTDVNGFFKMMPHLRRRGIQIMLDAKAIFFLSDAYRKHVFERYVPGKYRDAIRQKTYIIPNGVDDFWLKNLSPTDNVIKDTIRLIYAGRIDRNKNIVTTQKAIDLLREKGYDVTLTVVGVVEDKGIYEDIQSHPYTTCISAKPKELLIDLLREHNIFVMPSFTESFGLSYVEAMSQGLPVIYSRGQGFDNQFSEGVVGYHVSAYDVKDVAVGIERLIKDFDNIKKNVVSAAKQFNWQRIALQYEKIYKL